MPGRVVRHVFRMTRTLAHEAPGVVAAAWAPAEGSSAQPFASSFQQAAGAERAAAVVERPDVGGFQIESEARAVAPGADAVVRAYGAGDFEFELVALGWFEPVVG